MPSSADPYRSVIGFLLTAALVGTAGSVAAGILLSNSVMFDAAISLWLGAGILVGVFVAHARRARPPAPASPSETTTATASEAATATATATASEAATAPAAAAVAPATEPPVLDHVPTFAVETPADENAPAPGAPGHVEPHVPPDLWTPKEGRNPYSVVGDIRARVEHWFRTLGVLERIALGIAAAGIFATAEVLSQFFSYVSPTPIQAGIGAGAYLIAAGFAATAARYLAALDIGDIPEAPGLARGARVTAWMLVLTAGSVGLQWMQWFGALRLVHVALLVFNVVICYSLYRAARRSDGAATAFPVNLGPLALFGGRANIAASVLDTAERQLGIDLRSTWALTVVRRGIEPLAIALFLVGWLSTSLTVVGVQEQGLIERLGVSVSGDPLAPGLHLHWPWPIDKVFRIPIRRVDVIDIGHEGEEAPGPENVLWAVEHAANEYTLVLGNGHDLVTIDANVQYRIVDARAWRYHCQNPADALHAIAYRAVMRKTVDRTLADVLSQNIATMADTLSTMVQAEADSLGLGIKVVGFTFGGMHPPVPVAASYEAVISSQIRKVTAVVNAQVFRNQTLPNAQASVLVGENTARADSAQSVAVAAGESWSFRTLESQYRTAPDEYMFRRRLEALEQGLTGHPFTIVDFRFLRDGGELWVNP